MFALRICCIALLFCASQAMASIKIAVIDWCPYICPNDSEKPGFLVEYTQAIFADLEKELDFEVYPWSRGIKMANEGKVHALLAPAKSEAPNLLYPTQEIGIQQFCFFSRQEDPWHFDGLTSLKGRTVIVPIDAQPPEIEKQKHEAIILTYPYNDTYMPKATDILLGSRVDNFIMTYHSVRHYLNQNQLNTKVKTSGCIHQQNLYLAFSPALSMTDEVTPLIERFERNITKLKQQQFFDKLLSKYKMN